MRIRNTIAPTHTHEDERRDKDSALKQSSHTRMRQWPDSIEMAKKNKLESRKKVFFEKEFEKRKVDEEERKFQEIQKHMVVERANKLLFEAQDPVKSFHSKLLLSDVHKERDYQQEIKERQREIERRIEANNIEMEEQQIREYDIKEMKKQEEEKRKKEHQLNVINNQFEDFKIKKIKEYQDYIIEGEMVKLAAKKGLEDDKKKEEERRMKAKLQQKQFEEGNKQLLKMKEDVRNKEKEEIKKIEEYAIKKQQMVDLRKRKEEEKFKEKQDRRQKMLDKQIEYLTQLKNREDEILDKQVKEAEEKKTAAEVAKKKKWQEMKKQMDENREYQIARKKHIKDMEKKEDKEFIESWKDKMGQLVSIQYLLLII